MSAITPPSKQNSPTTTSSFSGGMPNLTSLSFFIFLSAFSLTLSFSSSSFSANGFSSLESRPSIPDSGSSGLSPVAALPLSGTPAYITAGNTLTAKPIRKRTPMMAAIMPSVALGRSDIRPTCSILSIGNSAMGKLAAASGENWTTRLLLMTRRWCSVGTKGAGYRIDSVGSGENGMRDYSVGGEKKMPCAGPRAAAARKCG